MNSLLRKQTIQLENGEKNSKASICRTNKHVKMYWISLIGKEMQIKTMIKYHEMPVRMTEIQNIDNSKCWQGCGINWNSHTLNKLLNGSQIYDAEWKSISKSYMLYYSIYILFLKWQNYSDGEHISCCQGLDSGGVCIYIEVASVNFYSLIMVMVTQINTQKYFTETPPTHTHTCSWWNLSKVKSVVYL